MYYPIAGELAAKVGLGRPQHQAWLAWQPGYGLYRHGATWPLKASKSGETPGETPRTAIGALALQVSCQNQPQLSGLKGWVCFIEIKTLCSKFQGKTRT